MATLENALIDSIVANYGGGGGGGATPANIVNLNDYVGTQPFSREKEWIVVYIPKPAKRVPFNENFVNIQYDVKTFISTPTSDDRLKEIYDEVISVINSNAITGINAQWVSVEDNVTDRRGPTFMMEITSFFLRMLAVSDVAYSASSTPHTHDDRYYTEAEMNAGQMDTRYYTEAEVDALILTEDTLVEMNDVTIAGIADNHVLTYDNATSKWINEAQSALTGVDHDAITNFVANEHIDHTGVTITAGAGMTGGGTIAANRTLDVIGGVGITVNADDIDCDITQYTDADALAHIVGQNPLTLTNGLTIGGALAGVTNLSMTGELDMTGASAWIDLNPAGTGSKNIIDITPTAALVAGSSWRGLRINSTALDPATGATSYVYGIEIENRFVESVDKNAYIHGVVVRSAPGDTGYSFVDYITEKTQNKTHSAFYSYFGGVLSATATYRGTNVDWSGVTRDANAPILQGIKVELPADYTDFGANYAGYFSGDGRSVTICDTTYALNVSGAMNFVGAITGATSINLVVDDAYGIGWNGVTTIAPSKNAVYDQLVTHYANTDTHHAQTHTHDGDTLQADGINSDVGAFPFTTTGAITFNTQNLLGISNLYVADDIIHTGDTNTLISFGTDIMSFETNGASRIDLTWEGVRLGAANSRVTTILDEDDMVSNSATALATQQSIKQYADSIGGAAHTLSSHSDVTMTGAEHASMHLYGVGNHGLIPCTPIHADDISYNWSSVGWTVMNTSNVDCTYYYILALPQFLGTLDLFIDGWEIGLQDADAGDYITQVDIYSNTETGAFLVNSDPTNRQARGDFAHTFAPVNVGNREQIIARLSAVNTDAGQLEISFFKMRCYYATP